MKEIGIEKLIKLLNEYGNERYDYWGDYQTFMDFSDRDIYWYLSKKFGFIKWLVENDKIDEDKCDVIKDIYNDELPRKYTRYDTVLMGLSIQDEPIEFLISILK